MKRLGKKQIEALKGTIELRVYYSYCTLHSMYEIYRTNTGERLGYVTYILAWELTRGKKIHKRLYDYDLYMV